MAKTFEQREQEMEQQIRSLKQAVTLLSNRLIHAERKLSQLSERSRRQSDAITRIERKLSGG